MCFMWYLNDVFSLLIGVCKEALGLAHRAQQKHRSLSTSRTIQQQLQRSLILAGELRGETKKSRELFANQWSTSWALITLRRLRIDVPGYRPTQKRLCIFLGMIFETFLEGHPFWGPGLLMLCWTWSSFDGILAYARRCNDGTETKHIALRRGQTWGHDIAIVGNFNWFLQNFHHEICRRWTPFWRIFFKVVVQPQIEVQFNLRKSHIFMKGKCLNHSVSCSAHLRPVFLRVCVRWNFHREISGNETAPTNRPGIRKMLSSNWSKLQPLLPKRNTSTKPGKRKRNPSTENVEEVENVEKRNGKSTIPKAWKECSIAERCLDSNSFRIFFSVWQSISHVWLPRRSRKERSWKQEKQRSRWNLWISRSIHLISIYPGYQILAIRV